MQNLDSQKSTVEDLAKIYLAIRQRTEAICAPLEVEDYIPQPTVDVSPPKWNIAHTTWFFEEMILKRFSKNYKVEGYFGRGGKR